MLIEVKDDKFKYKIISDNGAITEDQADVLKNHIFAEKYSNHAVLNFERVYANSKENFTISLHNPYNKEMTGTAIWDSTSDNFSINPSYLNIKIKPYKTDNYKFKLKIFNEKFYHEAYPKLNFKLFVQDQNIEFTRDIVLKKHLKIKKSPVHIKIDGDLNEWPKNNPIVLYEANEKKPFAKINLCYNKDCLYIGAKVFDEDIVNKHTDSMIFLNDALIVSLDRTLRQTAHENNDMQLEFSNSNNGIIVYNRALNEKIDIEKSGISFKIKKSNNNSLVYEIALPSSYLKPLTLEKGIKFGLNFAINDFDEKDERKVIEWSPGIGFIGIDDTYQSQLHFAEVELE